VPLVNAMFSVPSPAPIKYALNYLASRWATEAAAGAADEKEAKNHRRIEKPDDRSKSLAVRYISWRCYFHEKETAGGIDRFTATAGPAGCGSPDASDEASPST
jgi:hypothetical protein